MVVVQDNSDPATQDNQDLGDSTPAIPGAEGAAHPEPAVTEPVVSASPWKDKLNSDIKNSPLLAKFEDTADGLNKAMESHANLEKLLGHEKVPIPKGVDDVEGWNRFNKAMGIPDKSEGYGLADVELPGQLAETAISKQEFAEIVHAHKLTPAQAKGLWDTYNKVSKESFAKFEEDVKNQLNNTINELKGKWGDTYDTNIELGQAVINKFSPDQETNDYLTATLSKDAKGIQFLAKIGAQFAENKIGNFEMNQFSLAPEQASEEIRKIVKDPKHPYNDPDASAKEHQAAVDYVNSLYATVNKPTI